MGLIRHSRDVLMFWKLGEWQ